MRDFQLVLQVMEKMVDFASETTRKAFDLDPSGRLGIHSEACSLTRQIETSSFLLQDIYLSRQDGLVEFKQNHLFASFQYQSI